MDAAEIILRKESKINGKQVNRIVGFLTNFCLLLAGNLQLLFISAGVVGGIVVLIACVMIIVVCQRRSNKKVEGTIFYNHCCINLEEPY